MRNKLEEQLQTQCYNWFLMQYERQGNGYIFAVPNGGSRHKLEAINMKRSGVRAGVADIVVLFEGRMIFIELKAPTTYKQGKREGLVIDKRGGTQSDEQKDFQNAVQAMGYEYHLCDNLNDFMGICNPRIEIEIKESK